MLNKNVGPNTRQCNSLSHSVTLSPRFAPSDSNNPDSLLVRSLDQSCTFSQPLHTHPLHSHSRTLSLSFSPLNPPPTSSLLLSMCHWLLLSYKPLSSFFVQPIKALLSPPLLTDAPFCKSTLFLLCYTFKPIPICFHAFPSSNFSFLLSLYFLLTFYVPSKHLWN